MLDYYLPGKFLRRKGPTCHYALVILQEEVINVAAVSLLSFL
jgi:hypothetical protein